MTRLLRSRRILTPEGFVDGAVEVRGEKIARVVPSDALGVNSGAEELGDLVLMPGLVDSHAHINEPGRTDWEGFETATRAAAAGGITTIVDMPLNSIPVTTTPDALRQKVEATTGKIRVDCAFWGGLVPDNAGDLAELVKAGVVGAKAFLVHSGIDEFPRATEADLLRGMRALAAAGAPLIAHAEVDRHPPDERARGDVRSYQTYLASRPPEWEVDAISLLVALAKETGCATHIVHLSAADALSIVARAQASGLPFSAETCPHYLTLAAEEIPDGRCEFKCAPPIREKANQERLWKGLRDGVISMVVSDHSPCTPELKRPAEGDFMNAWGGIASLELGLSNIWTHAQARGHSLSEVSRWMSAAPARLAGLGQKGAIAPGKDADLIAFDPDALRDIRLEALHQRHRVTPYAGRTVKGRVVSTWLRGEKIYDGGDFVGAPLGRVILGRTNA